MAKRATREKEGLGAGRITERAATEAAKAAKRAFEGRTEQPAEWKKGGREWERVLGGFGPAGKAPKK